MSIKKVVEWIKGIFRKRPKPKPPVTPPPVTPPPVTPPPLFVDNFSQLDATKWIVSSWSAPMGGKFSPAHVFIVDGVLCLKLSQAQTEAGILSTGGEIATREKFGYGTYEFEIKASSNSPVPNQSGDAVSGSITGCFNYAPSSITEIDIEVEGGIRSPLAQFTSWIHETKPNEHTTFRTAIAPHTGFIRYKFVWAPTSITFFVNDVRVATHTTVIPTTPAPFMFNHWGTDNVNWGGAATPGVDRFMFVKSFRFAPI